MSAVLRSQLDFFINDNTVTLHASTSISIGSFPSFDPARVPSSFSEAVTRPDALTWRVAMDQEKLSLDEMEAFEEVDLPKGEWMIGLKWVYTHKTDLRG